MKHRGWKWTDRTRMAAAVVAIVLAAAVASLVKPAPAKAGWTWDDRSGVVWVYDDGAWGSWMDWKPGVDAP